jgi:hypothetical protein
MMMMHAAWQSMLTNVWPREVEVDRHQLHYTNSTLVLDQRCVVAAAGAFVVHLENNRRKE